MAASRLDAASSRHMKTTLSNTLNDDFVVETISLYTEGINFESYPVTQLKLAAGEDGVEVTLHGKALEPGKLAVRGFLVRAFNVRRLRHQSDSSLWLIAWSIGTWCGVVWWGGVVWGGVGRGGVQRECARWGTEQTWRGGIVLGSAPAVEDMSAMNVSE